MKLYTEEAAQVQGQKSRMKPKGQGPSLEQWDNSEPGFTNKEALGWRPCHTHSLEALFFLHRPRILVVGLVIARNI